MATRINTKFVIILAVSLIALTGVGVFAVMSLNKTAEENVALGDKALSQAEEALAQGDTVKANGLFKRARAQYGSARNKQPLVNNHLFKYIDANERIVCSDLTLANNEVRAVIEAAISIHDTPQASDSDRAYLYEKMFSWYRMRPSLNSVVPLAHINTRSTKRLEQYPDDAVAIKWRGIIDSYQVESQTDLEKRLEMLQNITRAHKDNPNDPWVTIAAARYHVGDARRQYRANGNTYSDEVSDNFTAAELLLQQAMDQAKQDPAALLEAVLILLEIRNNNEEAAAALLGRQIEAAEKLNTVLQDKAARDQLYIEELNRVTALFRLIGNGTEKHPFGGVEKAQALAEAVRDERPDNPGSHATLGSLYQQRGVLDKAEAVIEQGLAIENKAPAVRFVRNQQMRIEMLSDLAEVKIDLALRAEDKAGRAAALGEAGVLIDKLEGAAAADLEMRDARVDYLRGRIELALGRPAEAITLMERADQRYQSRNLPTLRYLAQAHMHGKLQNTAKAIEIYEQIVALQPVSPLRLNLINLYLSQREDQQLDRAEAHLKQFMTTFPNNLTGIRLMGNLLAQRGEPQKAIDLLHKADPDEHPELRSDIDRYLAMTGDTKGLLDNIRKQLEDRPEGTAMNLALVTQLINLIPDKEAKQKELDRLASAGMDPNVNAILKSLIEKGSLTAEQELSLLESQSTEPAKLAMQKFLLYKRRGEDKLADEQFAQAQRLDPKMPLVIEWRYRNALQGRDWAAARQAVDDMLELGLDERPEMALAEGAFMRARIVAAQAAAIDPGDERNKKFRDAARVYDEALRKYPAYADGWLQLGRIQLMLENNFAAQSSLREALSLQSRDVEVLENLARAEAATGDLQQALERFRQILRIDPNHPTALNQFSALAMQTGQTEQAVALHEQVRELRPNDVQNRRQLALLYARNGSLDKAREEIQAVITIEGKTLSNMAAMVQVLVLSDQLDAAIENVKSYLVERGDESTWRDHLLLAETYERAGKLELAEQSFTKAIQREGDESFAAAQAWGRALQARGEVDRATGVFIALSEAHPDNEALKTQAAQVLLQNKQWDRGEALAKSLPASPERSQLLIGAALGKGNLTTSIDRAREGVRSFPNQYVLREQLCRLILNQQAGLPEESRKYAEALSLAEALQKDFSERVDARVLVADVLYASGKTEEAVTQIERVLNFAPTHLGATQRLYDIRIEQARALARANPQVSQERAAQALRTIALLIKSRPDLTELNRNAGEAAALAGQFDQAASYYRVAFNNTKDASDLGGYTSALLAIGQGADALAVLQNPDNASLLSNNLYLRALRGRALAMTGSQDSAANLFTNTLDESKQDPAVRKMLTDQAALAFRAEPERLMQIVESVFGAQPPEDVDLTVITLLMGTKQYAPAVERLVRYEDYTFETPAQQSNVLLLLALALQNTNELERSKATYEKALALGDKHGDAIPPGQRVQMLNNMAYLLADQLPGYEDQAVTYAKQALSLLPKDESQQNVALIQDTLGWALFKAGRTDESIEQLKRSIERYSLAANMQHLGRVYLARGDESDNNLAVDLLSRALDQAKAEGDKQMIQETEKWFKQALDAGP